MYALKKTDGKFLMIGEPGRYMDRGGPIVTFQSGVQRGLDINYDYTCMFEGR